MEPNFDLICDYYSRLERQGPGSPEITRQALSYVEGLTDASRIADVGCGTGGQTLELAAAASGMITGVDLFPAFIDLFNHNAAAAGLDGRMKGIVGSMEALTFEEESLDLIWSEGAIYNIGFERGLKEWNKFLKPGGYIAVSEISWFTDERPDEINDFWCGEYPEMDTVPNKVAVMEAAGYEPIASFVLPEACWTDNYYAPQEKRMKEFLASHAGNPAAEGFIAGVRYEIELYEKHKEYFGYTFYIGKKR